MTLLKQIRSGSRHSPPRLLLYGTEGIGKSTTASQAPKTIFIPTEDGLDQIDCDSFPLARRFDEVMSAISALYSEQHDYPHQDKTGPRVSTYMICTPRNPSRIRHNPSRMCDGLRWDCRPIQGQNGESVMNPSRASVTDFGSRNSSNRRYISSLSINPSLCHAHLRARRVRVRARGCDGFT